MLRGRDNGHHVQQASGQDAFVNLPTGFGKSVIFQVAAPFCWDFLRQIQAGSPSSIAIVISPLSALMKDQLHSLSTRGIQVACLTKETPPATKTAIARGQYSAACLLVQKL